MSLKLLKWLLVQWNSGKREIVNMTHLCETENESLRIGSQINLNTDSSEVKPAILLSVSSNRQDLEQIISVDQDIVVGVQNDYTQSESSWKPSDDGSTNDDSETEKKMIKLKPCKRQYINRRTSKNKTPINKVNPLIPNMLITNDKPSRQQEPTEPTELTIPTEHTEPTEPTGKVTITIDIKDIQKIKLIYRNLFNILNKHKLSLDTQDDETKEMSTMEQNTELPTIQSDERSLSESSYRSADNVLITNKYDNINNKYNASNFAVDDNDWVPIGSGKTLIHRDDYFKVNWKNYTTATRTLLLAVFPRRLAPHSLTDKKLSALHNKQVKMSLNPKALMDIIKEITSKYNVKTSKVRSIITTKCVDEMEMYRKRKLEEQARRASRIKQTSSNIPIDKITKLFHIKG